MVFWIALATTLLIAFGFGAAAERTGAILIALGSVASVAVVSPLATRFQQAELPMAGLDIMILLAFMALSLRTERFWPLWATSFHAVTVFTHIANIITPRSLPAAYSILQGFWVYPMMFVVILGAYGHQRAKGK